MDTAVSFPEVLRRERELRGWTQEQLAARVGVEVKAVRRWESGISFPRPYTRQKLSKILGKSIQELGLVKDIAVDGNVVAAPRDEQAAERHDSCDEQVVEIPPLRDNQETARHDSCDEQAAEIATSQAARRFYRRTVGEVICTYDAHASWVLAVDWEPGGERIASAGGDGVVRVWDATSVRTLLTYRGHEWLFQKVNWLPTIYALAWSPLGGRIASAGDGRKVYVWDATDGETISEYEEHTGVLSNVFALAWSPDGKFIASACSTAGIDKTVHVWNAKSGHKKLHYDASYGLMPHFSVSSLAWSHDGKRLAAACGDKTIRIWDTTTGKLKSLFSARSDYVYTLAWSSDDQRLALAHGNSTAEIIDAFDGGTLLTYSKHRDNVRDIAWSPDGKRLATASNDTTVQIWDATNGNHIYTFEKHTAWTTSVAWSPDGTRISSTSNDKTVQVWQAV